MEAYRPDRVVRVLTALVSIAYFVACAGTAIALVAVPAVKLLAGGHPEWEFGLKVPATARDAEAIVPTGWGDARLVVKHARADLQLPIAMLPWWLVAVLWTHAAVALGLVVLSLHHLRRIFQRVRDGAPFDADNALRMRWLGLLLLALALFDGVSQFVTALALRGGVASPCIAVARGLRVDAPLVFVALALVALAEIFRRGAELETEQSLVI
jgi:hypothetical protein